MSPRPSSVFAHMSFSSPLYHAFFVCIRNLLHAPGMALSLDSLQTCLDSLAQEKAGVLQEIASADLKIAAARDVQSIALHKQQVAQTKYEGKYHTDGELTAGGHPKRQAFT